MSTVCLSIEQNSVKESEIILFQIFVVIHRPTQIHTKVRSRTDCTTEKTKKYCYLFTDFPTYLIIKYNK